MQKFIKNIKKTFVQYDVKALFYGSLVGSIIFTVIKIFHIKKDLYLSLLEFAISIILSLVISGLGRFLIISKIWTIRVYIERITYISIIPWSIFWMFHSVTLGQYLYFGVIGYMYGIISLWMGSFQKKYMILSAVYNVLAYVLISIIYDIHFITSNYTMIICSFIFAYVAIYMVFVKSNIMQKQTETIKSLMSQLNTEKRNIMNEKNIADKLLLNILPEEIAKELKNDGFAKPRHYDSVSVMFTDFVGFTDIANQVEPNELVRELDNCFSYFDLVAKKYNLEKIKTIGDSYMTCAGIPNTNNTHKVDTVLAALEIQSFMLQTKEIKDTQGLPYWELRLGINTGPLVAGVIGEMKFAYDVFGDTVNTASRMESSGEKGMINISQSVYDSVKHFFECEHRGKVQAKRKGELDMYFVHGVKKEYSRKGEGRVPNKRFFRDYLRLKKYGTV